ncbi:PAS domain S-box protein [Pseudogemmatithrix spongiicola]|uniref:histidine kinase n=1 Tax=Pseudogemmatithrix spongiicola TaxID=3062599 RepID=A0AA49JV39_9BACT|nr:PAS domain S-box protein [Gemmatimonadaceae bacterium 'strain 138']WKW15314.1 PAS domain S-box protein [Gemmatimonadaceae bacterium 'strain 318']
MPLPSGPPSELPGQPRPSEAETLRVLELGFELAVTPTAVLDGEGRYLRVNEAFAQLFGHPKAWFVGRSFLEITHPLDVERDRGFIDRLREKHVNRATVEKRYRRADGALIYAQTSVAVLERDGDRPTLLMSEVQDITALHTALEALRSSEERLAYALDASNDGLWDWDVPTGRLFFNARWAEILGYDPDELDRHISTWEGLIHAEDRERADAALVEHIAGRTSGVAVDLRMRHRDGHWVWVHDRAKIVVRDANGSPRRIVGTHSDISARLQEREKLAAQKAVLDTVLSNIPIAIDIVGADGKVEYVNAHCERLLGWSFEEMLQVDLMAEVYPDPAYRAQVLASFDDGSAEWRDWQLRTRDGRTLTTSWANVRLADGRVIGMGTDVTQQRAAEAMEEHLERQLQESQKLESLGLLAGGIAHDFNNLLVGVMGNASLAEETLPPHSEARELVTEVRRAASRAADLTRQLLAYAGKGRFVVEPVNVSALVTEMASLLRAAVSKRATLQQDLASDLPAVEADATQLRQVVMNLITNASDALGDADGSIALRTSLQEPDAAVRASVAGGTPLAEGRYVCLEVEDSGAGMAPETLARIFDPFFTTKQTGHGLGLAATLGIVRAHRGGIRVESRAGRGTLVRLYLPALASTVRHSPTPQVGSVAALRGSGVVLLADDEESVRTVARRSLERSGFTVVACADGLEALDHFRKDPGRWRVVLLDLTMPGLGGQETLLAMREMRADLPALLCSGYASEELSPRILGLDGVGFLQKPFSVASLTAAIFELCPPTVPPERP